LGSKIRIGKTIKLKKNENKNEKNKNKITKN
jgi:hypothetical protein